MKEKAIKSIKADAVFQIADKNAEIDDLSTQLKEKADQFEKLKEELLQIKKKASSGDADLVDAQARLEEYKISLDENRTKLASVTTENSKLADTVETLTIELEKKDVTDMESKEMIAAGHAAEMKSLKEMLERQRRSHRDATEALQDQMAIRDSEFQDKLRKKEEDLESIKANLQHEKSISEVLGTQLDDARSEIDSLNARMRELTAVSECRDTKSDAKKMLSESPTSPNKRKSLSERNVQQVRVEEDGAQSSAKKKKKKVGGVSFARTVAGSMRGAQEESG